MFDDELGYTQVGCHDMWAGDVFRFAGLRRNLLRRYHALNRKAGFVPLVPCGRLLQASADQRMMMMIDGVHEADHEM